MVNIHEGAVQDAVPGLDHVESADGVEEIVTQHFDGFERKDWPTSVAATPEAANVPSDLQVDRLTGGEVEVFWVPSKAPKWTKQLNKRTG